MVVVGCRCVQGTMVPVVVGLGTLLLGRQTNVVKRLIWIVVKPYAKTFEVPS